MRLSDASNGRDNNYNLLRILAAFAVLLTHSFALVHGTGASEPLAQSLGMTLGSFAVDIFFLASGFLVTASLVNRKSVIEFIWARVLRIYPALLVMTVSTAFIVGPILSVNTIGEYFASTGVYRYFFKCSTLIAGVEFTLPGVFQSNPFRNAVNGSLWTMPYEVRMYACLVMVWLIIRAIPVFGVRFFKPVVVGMAVVSGGLVLADRFGVIDGGAHFLWLFFMFFSGAAYYILRDKIVLSFPVFSVLFLSLVIAPFLSKTVFLAMYPFLLPYVVFYLAYVPSGGVRLYNRCGDYSYGLYIYAFPVQQALVYCYAQISVFELILLSTICTLALAMLSWHFIEKRALSLKGNYVGHTRWLIHFTGIAHLRDRIFSGK